MGYQGNQLNGDFGANFTWLINTLPSVGKEFNEIKLKDFAVSSEGGLYSHLSVMLTTLGSDGQTIEDYSYVDQQLIDWYVCPAVTKPGWYVSSTATGDNPVSADEVVIPFMDGIQIQGDEAYAKITFAGEVLNENLPIALNGDAGANFTWTGNCSPVAIQLKDIAVTSEGGLYSHLSVMLTTLGSDGQTIEDYSYVDQQLIDWYVCPAVTEPGWYVSSTATGDNPVKAGDVWLQPGEMVQIQGDEAYASIVIPSALPAAE